MTMTPEQTAAMFKRVFEDHHEGRMCLEILIQRFARNAVTVGGIDAVLKTYQQDGSRKVLDHIMNQINIANGLRDDGKNDEEEQQP
ncbi:hypothetical protein DBR00_11520 [Pseudomonas sp. HMWF032]|uniref:Bbp19 family protein n=1 Tax=Pseudomonas sp. HMWF032 TaxID=2056866 RepID=UPI000D3902AC|nr:hypothetical protein [Pseudomonas sp. HMWF032]PTS84002.1 hypothetical protein DBR00_11520 [Pseudomonas sp. HMWF032]PTT85357.1 hypothetical protein DBR41_04105 [Pseudomonas sp. HMWF010]